MKRSLVRVVRVLVAAPLVFAITAGWAAAADAPDAWLTMKTKIALMTTENLSTSDLNVDTVQGVVTLHGKVATEGEKAKAETTARRIDGVKDVKNLLQVVPDAAKKAVERSDEQVKDAVVAAFKAKRVDASRISVQSVNKGTVLLAGKTESLQSHLDAVQVARAVPGVKRVATEVQVTGGTE
jgi:hyperosmotically inducible periplasmic protein